MKNEREEDVNIRRKRKKEKGRRAPNDAYPCVVRHELTEKVRVATECLFCDLLNVLIIH